MQIPLDPDGWEKAVERWGFDAVAHPTWGDERRPCDCERGVGLGDIIKWITGLFGVKPCSACEERRRKLNRWRVGRH